MYVITTTYFTHYYGSSYASFTEGVIQTTSIVRVRKVTQALKVQAKLAERDERLRNFMMPLQCIDHGSCAIRSYRIDTVVQYLGIEPSLNAYSISILNTSTSLGILQLCATLVATYSSECKPSEPQLYRRRRPPRQCTPAARHVRGRGELVRGSAEAGRRVAWYMCIHTPSARPRGHSVQG